MDTQHTIFKRESNMTGEFPFKEDLNYEIFCSKLYWN